MASTLDEASTPRNRHATTPEWMRLAAGGRQSTYALVSRLASTAIAFATATLLARLLGAAHYGAYAFAVSYAGLLAIAALVGMDQLTTRNLATALESGDKQRVFAFLRFSRRSLAWTSLVATGVGCLFVVANPLGWPAIYHAPTIILAAAVPLTVVLRIGRARLQAVGRAAAGIAIEFTLLNSLLLAAAVLAMVVGAQTSGTFAVMHLFGAAIAAAIAVVWSVRLLPRPTGKVESSTETTKVWRSQRTAFFFVAGTSLLFLQGDILLLANLGQPQDVGRYSAASRLAALCTLAAWPAQQVAAPIIARAWHRRDLPNASREAQRAGLFALLIAVPAAVTLGVGAYPALRLFGPTFDAAGAALQVLLLAQVVYLLFGPAHTALAMVDKERTAAWVTSAGLLVGLSFAWVMFSSLGLMALAVGRLLTNLLVGSTSYYQLRKLGIDSLPWRRQRHGP